MICFGRRPLDAATQDNEKKQFTNAFIPHYRPGERHPETGQSVEAESKKNQG